jgi:hypothetical protein
MDFFEFIELMKAIPKPNDVDELCKSNLNYSLVEKLVSYFPQRISVSAVGLDINGS